MIDELAKINPVLLEALVKGAGGIIGEHIVAQALASRGFDVNIIANNARERDLEVAGVGTVEVKAVRGRATWFVSRRPSRADFWVLARLPKFDVSPIPSLDQVELFVFRLHEVQRIWDDNPWNQKNPTNGDIRPAHMPANARDAWHKMEV